MTRLAETDTQGDRQRKNCVSCFEEIDARARRCRYCGGLQTRLQRWVMSSRWPARILALVVLIMAGSAAVFASRLFRTGNEFTDYKDPIRVLSSEMHTAQVDDASVVWVVGTLRNTSDVPWREVRIEVQFLDGAGRMVDVARGSDSLWAGPIGPGQDAGYKLKIARDFPEDRYVSHKVFVRYADDADSWP